MADCKKGGQTDPPGMRGTLLSPADVPQKCWYPHTALHVVTKQMTTA